jgi:hypothetical protein
MTEQAKRTPARPGQAVELRVGQVLTLDSGRITITLESKSGQRARLRIQADASLPIVVPARREAIPQ